MSCGDHGAGTIRAGDRGLTWIGVKCNANRGLAQCSAKDKNRTDMQLLRSTVVEFPGAGLRNTLSAVTSSISIELQRRRIDIWITDRTQHGGYISNSENCDASYKFLTTVASCEYMSGNRLRTAACNPLQHDATAWQV